jgi:hypothetical protein
VTTTFSGEYAIFIDFNVYGSIGTSASRGVAIFINEAVNYKVIDKFTDENGRIVLLNVQIDDAVFFVLCLALSR